MLFVLKLNGKVFNSLRMKNKEIKNIHTRHLGDSKKKKVKKLFAIKFCVGSSLWSNQFSNKHTHMEFFK